MPKVIVVSNREYDLLRDMMVNVMMSFIDRSKVVDRPEVRDVLEYEAGMISDMLERMDKRYGRV